MGPYGRVVSGHTQSTQDVSSLTDGPEGNLLHAALGQAGQDGDVTQWNGRDFLPGTSQLYSTLPAETGNRQTG